MRDTPPPATDAAAPRSDDAPGVRIMRWLTELLDLELIDTDLYRGAHQGTGQPRVFGGQVIAQALAAAARSVETGAVAHSLHAYFMRPGDDALPIVYRVERDFEGRSFATRRVIALQRGQPILNMAASFQAPEEGLTHQVAMPDAPDPDTLISWRVWLTREAERGSEAARAALNAPVASGPIELRPVSPRGLSDLSARAPADMTWFRTTAPVAGGPDVHRAILAYASDMMLLGASMLPHAVTFTTPGMQVVSLDHALWMHETPRVDDWLLYVTDSPWSGHGRGFTRGQVFDRSGRLVASVAQEGLIRRRAPRPDAAG